MTLPEDPDLFAQRIRQPEEARALLPMIDLGRHHRRDRRGAPHQARRTDGQRKEITMLCKSLLPMPEKYHGFAESRRATQALPRHHGHEEPKRRFQSEARIVSSLRRFLEDEGFMEVETPMLQPIYGGATRALQDASTTLKLDMYLRIAPELNLKRILFPALPTRSSRSTATSATKVSRPAQS